MDPIKRSPADALRSEVTRLSGSANIFVRKGLGDLPAFLDAWITSVEARFAALQKMPAPEVLRLLAETPMRSGGPTATEVIANCGGCSAGTDFHEPTCPLSRRPPECKDCDE